MPTMNPDGWQKAYEEYKVRKKKLVLWDDRQKFV
jgi:hypothetical protein